MTNGVDKTNGIGMIGSDAVTRQGSGPAGFEARLLQALTDIDGRRPASASSSAADRRQVARGRRRHRGRLGLAVAVAVVTLGGTAAAAAGLFPSAPDSVQRIFTALDGTSGHRVDAAAAVKIGVIDDHPAYAAPTADGGFCLHFGDNPRSGPTGSTCITRGAGPGEVVFNVMPGTDGGFIFGRAGDTSATRIDIAFAGAGGVSAPVGEQGFFMAAIPPAAMDTLMIKFMPGPGDPPTKDGGPIVSFDLSRIATIGVTSVDSGGHTVGHGVPVTLPEPERTN